VARRLTTVAGPDDLVARVHGDVFAVMLSDVASSQDVRDRAAALLACLASPIDAGGVRVRIEATAGLAERPDRDHGAAPTMVELLRRADVAMRQAKRGGPRVARYDPTRDPADIDTLVLGGELARAIADGEFAVCFQPIVDLRTGAMVAAEALTRWQHPVRGQLDPRSFLDAVERSGLVLSFEEEVLDQPLSAATRWRAAGIDASVAVNVGPRSLLDPDYPSLVLRTLRRHDAAPAGLVIELSESLTLDDLELAGPALAQLRAAGVRLALDDFGMGSSSMAILTRVPGVDLKIDRSFVAAMHTSPEALAVVRATVEFGRALGRVVVAEGVEREDQRRTLARSGCPNGQGHLFARALPVDEFLSRAVAGVDGVAGRLARPLD
jgi:predicted signal transduction protein with EAL and GGDEF domain